MAIAIRTAVVEGDLCRVQAGAGIVADSVPEKEYREAKNKAAALFRAVEMARSWSVASEPNRRCAPMIFIVDNYDSFTYNLVQAMGKLDPDVEVARNDRFDPEAVAGAPVPMPS